MNITMIGTGYVGLTTGTCLANLGNNVICLDVDEHKINLLKQGKVPIFEPGLKEMIERNVAEKRLSFTIDYKSAVESAEIIFLAVGTPEGAEGEANLTYLYKASQEVARYMNNYKIIVIKSTVPVGTSSQIKSLMEKHTQQPFDIVSNPEFLREGSAIRDFTSPDRVIIGVASEKAAVSMKKLYENMERPQNPIMITDIKSSELIKCASNAMLATRISFMNQLSPLCEKVGADVKEVAKGMGLDDRIGPRFLQAGVGYGGSCLVGDEEIIIKQNKVIYPIKLSELFAKFKDEKNIHVLSFDTNNRKTVFKQILGVTKRAYNDQIIKIRTKMNKYISTTADHPFIIYQNNKFTVKLACQLQINDELPSFLEMPVEMNNISIDVIEKIKETNSFNLNKIRVRSLIKQFKEYPEVIAQIKSLKTYRGRSRDILRDNCMTLEEFFQIEENLYPFITRNNVVLFTSKGNTTYCPAIIQVNKEFCRLLGYYISEGHIHYEQCLRGERARIGFHFNIKEHEFIQEVCSILEKLSIKYTLSNQEQNNTTSIIISSRVLAFIIDEILNCGINSYDARVPEIIYNLSNQQKQAFLSTVFRGDGHITKEKNTPAVVYDFGTISKQLITGMITLFHAVGIVPSYKKSKSKKSTDYAHFIRISGRDQIRKLPYFKDSKKQKEVEDRLQRYKKIIKPTGFKNISHEFATVKIREIVSNKEKVDVYSLEVEETKTFALSNGLIVHNCFPKDVKALAHTMKAYGLPSALFDAVDEINQRQKSYIIPKVKALLGNNLHGKRVALWGLSFKPRTDDIREAPSLTIIEKLLELGADVVAFDPVAKEHVAQLFPKIECGMTSLDTIKDADCLIIITEWDEFRYLDKKRIKELLRQPNIIDGRNIYHPEEMRELGFNYVSIGRV